MKRILLTEDSHQSLLNLLVELEILSLAENLPTDEVLRLRKLIKNAEDVITITVDVKKV